MTARSPRPKPRTTPCTLAIDVGGTGLKAIVLDPAGDPIGERVRVETSYPCPPTKLVQDLVGLVHELAPYDRVSVGFPGVVREGRIMTAPHFVTTGGPGTKIDPELLAQWTDFDLAAALSADLAAPVRVANDADVQGAGVVRADDGLQIVLTLGTGLGSAVFRGRELALHLELAHHVAFKGVTYNDYLGERARKKIGSKRWNRRIRKALAQIDTLVCPDAIVLGGGNASKVDLDWLRQRSPELAAKVRVVGNEAGLLGGIRLWDDHPVERT